MREEAFWSLLFLKACGVPFDFEIADFSDAQWVEAFFVRRIHLTVTQFELSNFLYSADLRRGKQFSQVGELEWSKPKQGRVPSGSIPTGSRKGSFAQATKLLGGPWILSRVVTGRAKPSSFYLGTRSAKLRAFR